jgi:thiol-disulfide isomerase/thioredoxin
MYRIAGIALLLLPALPAAGAEDKPKQSPGEQYKALLKAYQEDLSGAKTFQDRLKLAQEKYAPKFLELAEKDPKDPAAAEALVWVVTNVHARGKDNPQAKAVELLARDHVKSDKVGPVCQALGNSFDKASGDFLRAVLEQNPSRDVQGQACLALAEYLKNRKTYAEMLKDRPEIATALDNFGGAGTAAELKKVDLAKVDKEVEDLYERAADKYGDVKVAGGRTIADLAKPELYELKHLAVGKEAPDIKGEDLDGKEFKLSDYRGKVVMLDFWGNW